MSKEKFKFEGESEIFLSEGEEKLYNLVIPDYEKRRIKETDFKDLYGSKRVEADIKEIERIRQEIESRQSENDKVIGKKSKLFEAILSEQIEEQNWMGGEVMAVAASEYDDIKNRVDMILEFTGEEASRLALAVDLTTATNTEILRAKLKRIRDEIRSGELTRVKYFKSEAEDFRGELGNIPRVIVCADQRTLEDLSQLFLDYKNAAKNVKLNRQAGDLAGEKRWQEEFKKTRETIKNHPVQRQILEEIKIQLEKYYWLAEYHSQASREVKDKMEEKYAKFLRIIEDILEQKQDLPKKFDYSFGVFRREMKHFDEFIKAAKK